MTWGHDLLSFAEIPAAVTNGFFFLARTGRSLTVSFSLLLSRRPLRTRPRLSATHIRRRFLSEFGAESGADEPREKCGTGLMTGDGDGDDARPSRARVPTGVIQLFSFFPIRRIRPHCIHGEIFFFIENERPPCDSPVRTRHGTHAFPRRKSCSLRFQPLSFSFLVNLIYIYLFIYSLSHLVAISFAMFLLSIKRGH